MLEATIRDDSEAMITTLAPEHDGDLRMMVAWLALRVSTYIEAEAGSTDAALAAVEASRQRALELLVEGPS
ncbi:hypothetical protein [Allobranchiibius sp. CTAmp26]|uniref:hypothetical protein n=1 Tax=Allobranchiibius sp. CTAmp26 TaxID=2815214 RepID=UPI001AA106B8|nr:hypothetical protein [Allobranchiibius sp. CTAmp26]